MRRGQHFRIVIVGAGFSGLGMAIRLKQRGIDDFVVLERSEDLGGCWHYNTYPGCRCDVPSHLYSFSFAPNPGWSNTYSSQAEIRAYLRDCADRFGVSPHIATEVAFESGRWDDAQAVWQIETSAGPLTGSMLISAMGPLTEPKMPDVPGLDAFAGKIMHSARWDHEFDLSGKRIASIGTGASAIQYVPAIRPRAERLFVFQRTAPWVMPHAAREISSLERRLFRRLPQAQRLVRRSVYLSRELLVLGFVKRAGLMRALERMARWHIARQVADPGLRARVTPDYALGCKRLLPSNDWYPALEADNVELVDGGLAEVRSRSVVDRDGVEREVDVIILGTGFHVTDPPVAKLVRGRDGRLLSEVWDGSPRAYLGAAVPEFPNMFLLLGPNTGLGHSSMVLMIEAQIEHVLAAIELMDDSRACTIEVRRSAYERHNELVDGAMADTVWETGCASFYHDETGRNSVLWPDWTWRFDRLAGEVHVDRYALDAHVDVAVPV